MLNNQILKKDNFYYFLKKDGSRAENEWINLKYYNSEGKLVTNSWIYGFLYVDDSGSLSIKKYNSYFLIPFIFLIVLTIIFIIDELQIKVQHLTQ